MKNKRNKEMYEMYMDNPTMGYKDIANKFGLSEKTVSVIIANIMKENNTARSPKPIGNKMKIHDKLILEAFMECLSANKVAIKFNVSNGYILRLARNNGYAHLVKPKPSRKSEEELNKRNEEIWQYFLEYKPKSFGVIAEKFNLNLTNVKHIMRVMKEKHNYQVQDKKQNEYERTAKYLGIDVSRLFAY